jgi:hypothetical protein
MQGGLRVFEKLFGSVFGKPFSQGAATAPLLLVGTGVVPAPYFSNTLRGFLKDSEQ